MTWSAKIMPDDQVDPASLVGGMLQVERRQDDTTDGMVNQPLWELMDRARFVAALACGRDDDGFLCAAEIDALRNWLPRRPPKDFYNRLCAELQTYDVTMVGRTMDWLHELLAEQARIARGES